MAESDLHFWCYVIGSEPECPTKRRRPKLTNSRSTSNTGKREVEAGPAFGGVLGPDLAAVRLDERLGDGES